jgi:hypothetical protein
MEESAMAVWNQGNQKGSLFQQLHGLQFCLLGQRAEHFLPAA